MVEILSKLQTTDKTITLRNWKLYDAEIANAKLFTGLSEVNEKCDNLSVQEHWNVLENVLVNVIDESAPLFTPGVKIKNKKMLSHEM